jgi:pyruvate dehydrogenase E1 component alpha subunit
MQAKPTASSPSVETLPNREVALRLLQTMRLIRAFEERVSELTAAGQIPGLVHTSTGQEGVAAGVCCQLRTDDVVYTGHRGHGHTLAKGASPRQAMAELMGKADGLCHGKGGSMHLVDVEHGMMGATGVVGGNIPLALGNALAVRLRGGDQVSVVFFGDGAVQAGHFHESVNIATLWELPVILVCENNGFAEFTPRSAHTKVERVSDVVAPYELERATVDGNDVVAVYAAFGRFLAQARQGRGPLLLECLTYRLRGHYEGDPERYRQALEAAEWQARDPIVRLEQHGREHGLLSDEDVESARRAAQEAVDDAVQFAQQSPFPEPGDLHNEVYAEAGQ